MLEEVEPALGSTEADIAIDTFACAAVAGTVGTGTATFAGTAVDVTAGTGIAALTCAAVDGTAGTATEMMVCVVVVADGDTDTDVDADTIACVVVLVLRALGCCCCSPGAPEDALTFSARRTRLEPAPCDVVITALQVAPVDVEAVIGVEVGGISGGVVRGIGRVGAIAPIGNASRPCAVSTGACIAANSTAVGCSTAGRHRGCGPTGPVADGNADELLVEVLETVASEPACSGCGWSSVFTDVVAVAKEDGGGSGVGGRNGSGGRPAAIRFLRSISTTNAGIGGRGRTGAAANSSARSLA